MRILIVEDEFKIADVIASRLRNEQYIVDVYGEEGLDNALTNIYDFYENLVIDLPFLEYLWIDNKKIIELKSFYEYQMIPTCHYQEMEYDCIFLLIFEQKSQLPILGLD